MRIVQTLWTAGQSLTANAMGWLNPQMNLMSWALSANSMREHTDDLVLYTDTEGARTLVDRLKLPYTEVVVAYDELEIPTAHWAIPKIMSYARQAIRTCRRRPVSAQWAAARHQRQPRDSAERGGGV